MDELIACARAARANAHAPYSAYAVGAAVRADDGSVHVGCNVENAAYPESFCAEAGALAAMVVAGRKRLVAVAVCGGPPERPAMPCGGCRQKLSEFATPDAEVVVVDGAGGGLRRMRLAALLPFGFALGDQR
jgi:cytidine deaminase